MKIAILLALTVAGGLIGFAIGMAGKAAGGSCPLTCNPWGGTITGLVLGFFIASTLTLGRAGGAAAVSPEDEKAVLHIGDAAAFQAQVAAAKGLVLVDFYATWCGPCKRLAPILAALARENQGRYAVAKVDAEANAAIARQYGVEAYPTLVLLRDGKVVSRQVGALSKEDLATWLDGFVQPATPSPAPGADGAG